MTSQGSVTRWLAQIKAGDQAAAQQLWDRYYAQLLRLCRTKLAEQRRRAADEEDAALSAFDSFFRGTQQGRFPKLEDRNDIWQLLVVIAARKADDLIEREHRQKRGCGRVQGESALDAALGASRRRGIEQVIADQPTPEFAAIVAEEYERLIGCLNDETARAVAQLKLGGYSHGEIASRLGCSRRTVDRKLWLIRNKWSHEGGGDETRASGR